MRKQLINNVEFRRELEKINNWYFEQLERYNNGEIKESTFKSYKTRHKQRRNKLIKTMQTTKTMQTQEQNTRISTKSVDIFKKW